MVTPKAVLIVPKGQNAEGAIKTAEGITVSQKLLRVNLLVTTIR